jgi:hypothetical protein
MVLNQTLNCIKKTKNNVKIEIRPMKKETHPRKNDISPGKFDKCGPQKAAGWGQAGSRIGTASTRKG